MKIYFSVALSKSFPNVLSLGIEIRDKLVNYVGEKIRALRIENPGEVRCTVFLKYLYFFNFFCQSITILQFSERMQ